MVANTKKFGALTAIVSSAAISLLVASCEDAAEAFRGRGIASADNAVASRGSEQTRGLACKTGPVVPNAAGKKNVAMIVGIDNYASGAIPNLKGAVNDARRFYDVITGGDNPGFPTENVCVLTDSDATYARFVEKFHAGLIDREGIEDADTVLFYFAGHGSRVTDYNGDESDQHDETLILQNSQERIVGRSQLGEDLKDRLKMANGKLRSYWPHLVDDEFNSLLSKAYDKSKNKNLVIILDSCHSGTGTRGEEDDEALAAGYVSRYVDADAEDEGVTIEQKIAARGAGDGEIFEFTPALLGASVFLSAAQDYEKAYERAGSGLFTSALVKHLINAREEDITYNQLIARVSADLSSSVKAKQTPRVSGETGKVLFSNDIPLPPVFGWIVESATPNEEEGETFAISGVPTPGMGVGAELVILPGSYDASAEQNIDYAKARVVVKGQPASNVAEVEIVKILEDKKDIRPGDYAVLRKISDEASTLRVKIRAPGENGAVADVAALKSIITNIFDERSDRNAEQEDVDQNELNVSKLINFVEAEFDLEIGTGTGGGLTISDRDGVVRNTPRDATEAANDLMNHLYQLTLMSDWKIEGGTMAAGETVKVSLVRKDKESADSYCKDSYSVRDWKPGPANTPQEIPLCAGYQIEVALAKNAPVAVNIAGSYLAANGERLHFPYDKNPVTLRPGDPPWVFEAEADHFQALPDGIGIKEHIFVLALPVKPAVLDSGVTINFKMPWHLLAMEEPEPRGRGAARGTEKKRNEYGTFTILPITVKANYKFDETAHKTSKVTDEIAQSREYTIDNFDITPYLPDDENSALHLVLQSALKLTKWGAADGVDYKQHRWCERSDDANLSVGIDCSRAIWYAFTRAEGGGVPYNRYTREGYDESFCVSDIDKYYSPENDGYVYTGDMYRKDTLMADEFNSCMVDDVNEIDKNLQLGDVLVYQDAVKGDGHTVMVIDPKERIAWGSHGWDGSPNVVYRQTGERPAQDRGVEFQKIKIKQDWQRWDRSTMKLVGCWRHKMFAEQAKAPAGRPGLEAICLRTIKALPSFYQNTYCGRYFEQ